MKRLKENTVFDKLQRAVFYVVKFKDKYLGEEGLVDNFDDAKAFDDYDDAEWDLDDFIDDVDLKQALADNPYNVQYFIDEEKKYWAEDWEIERKSPSGLIDDYDARQEVRKMTSVEGVFATGLKIK